MARNPYSGEGTDLGIAFLRTPVGGSLRHSVRGDYAARAFAAFIGRLGIVQGEGNELACTVNAQRVVSIDTGDAWMSLGSYNGVAFNDSVKTRTLALPATGARVDAIVLRYTVATAVVDFAVVQGTEGGGKASTVANLTTGDQPLAYITVPTSGTPSVELEATRFFQPTAPATETGAAALSAADMPRTIQAPEAVGTNIATVYGHRSDVSVNATKMWALDSSNNLVEYEDFGYGYVRNEVADRTFGSGTLKFIFGYYDTENTGQQWVGAILDDGGSIVCRAHVTASGTASRITTAGNAISLPNPGGAIPTGADPAPSSSIGIQVSSDTVIVVTSGVSMTVAMFQLTVASPIAASFSPVLGAATVSTSTNASWSLLFAAKGSGESVLAIFNSAADTDFHEADDNGTIERWLADGTKQSVSAPAPRGNLLGRKFNLASGASADITENDQVFSGNRALAQYEAWNTGFVLPDNMEVADGTETYVFASPLTNGASVTLTRAQFLAMTPETAGVKSGTAAADANSTQAGSFLAVARSATNEVIFIARQGALGTRAFTVTESYTWQRPSASNIFTLTRITDVLCFASRELIFPVQDASDQAGFWPFIGAGQ